jgi:hypothetical protein
VILIVVGFSVISTGVGFLSWQAGVITAGILTSVLGLLLIELKD